MKSISLSETREDSEDEENLAYGPIYKDELASFDTLTDLMRKLKQKFEAKSPSLGFFFKFVSIPDKQDNKKSQQEGPVSGKDQELVKVEEVVDNSWCQCFAMSALCRSI